MDYKLLKKLCDMSGVSGFEKELLGFIAEQIYDFADDIYFDRLGNLIAFKKGTRGSCGKKILYSCHADEVGFVIKYIEDDGRLVFDGIGISDKILPGEKLLIGKKKIPGVISLLPSHLVPKSEKDSPVDAKNLFIDIGADTKEKAESLGVYADYAVFDSRLEPFGDKLLKGKALDDSIGCALLCGLIKSDIPHDSYFAFCVGEELGLRGSSAVARELLPDICINIEATTAGDIYGVEGAARTCELYSGAVLPFMDGSAIYSQRLRKAAIDIAKTHGIKTSTKSLIAGGTDAGAYTKLTGKTEVLGIALPTRYIHSPHCTAAKDDMEQMEKLIFAISENIGAIAREE